ncbi:MAG: hypothetical protein NXI20_28060 [bacterium]|nr:hypothetical protein [bacterium]
MILVLLCKDLNAQTPIVLGTDSEHGSIGKYTQLFSDDDRLLKLSTIQDLPFSDSKDIIINLGYNNAADWIRFKIHNPNSVDNDRFICLSKLLTDSITLFYKVSDDWKKVTDGVQFPSSNSKNYQGYFLSITIPAYDTVTCYLRVVSSYNKGLDIKIKGQAKVQADDKTEILIFGLFAGAVIVIAIYNMFLGFSVRDRLYFYYVLVNFSTLFVVFNLEGVIVNWLPEDSRYLIPYLGAASISIHYFFIFLFNIKMLRLYKFSKSGFYTLLAFLVLNALIGLRFCILKAGGAMVDYRLGAIPTMLFPLIVIITGLLAQRNGSYFARFYLLGWIFPMLGAALLGMKSLGIVPSNLLTDNSYILGSILEVTLFSFSLAERYNIIQRDKTRLEEEIKYKEGDLALVISDNRLRYQFKEGIVNQMSDLLKLPEGSLASKLKSLVTDLKLQLDQENKLNLKQENIDNVNTEFESKLKSKYPELTAGEREFCQLLHLNLSSKEIAGIRKTSETAVRTMRYRIKKKLKVDSNDPLEIILKDL